MLLQLSYRKRVWPNGTALYLLIFLRLYILKTQRQQVFQEFIWANQRDSPAESLLQPNIHDPCLSSPPLMQQLSTSSRSDCHLVWCNDIGCTLQAGWNPTSARHGSSSQPGRARRVGNGWNLCPVWSCLSWICCAGARKTTFSEGDSVIGKLTIPWSKFRLCNQRPLAQLGDWSNQTLVKTSEV